MEEKKSEIMERSPNRLLTNFSKGYLWFGILVTILVHAVLIGATSVQYITDYLYPEKAAARKQAEVDAKQKMADKAEADKKALAASKTNAPAGGTNAPAAEKADPAKAGGGADALAGLTEEQKARPDVKKLTEVAKPEEMPRLDDIPQ